MPSLRDVRRRIRSVQNTKKITKAMELVAASKMRRAQERVTAARPYADELSSIMVELMRRNPEYKHPMLVPREVHRRVLILVTTDRGQVGGLNSNNVRLAVREINNAGVPVGVVTIGRKGRDLMRRLRKELIADQSMLGDRPTMGDVLPAVRVAIDAYVDGEADQVDLVFARFVSAGRQVATLTRLHPRGAARGRSEDPAPTSSTSPSPRTCSTPCCRAMSRARSTGRCWRTPPASRRRGCWRCATPATTPRI